MKVKGTVLPPPMARSVSAYGFNAFDSTISASVSNWRQYIRPDGNADQHRKGAPQ